MVNNTQRAIWVGHAGVEFRVHRGRVAAGHALRRLLAHPRKQDLVAIHILNAQRADGSWETYYDAAERRHQQHRRVLRGASCRRHSGRRRASSFEGARHGFSRHGGLCRAFASSLAIGSR